MCGAWGVGGVSKGRRGVDGGGRRRRRRVLPPLSPFPSLSLTCLARLPNTNSRASMTLDLPDPLGPTTEEKDCLLWGGGRERGESESERRARRMRRARLALASSPARFPPSLRRARAGTCHTTAGPRVTHNPETRRVSPPAHTLWKGPMLWTPAYDLKFSSVIVRDDEPRRAARRVRGRGRDERRGRGGRRRRLRRRWRGGATAAVGVHGGGVRHVVCARERERKCEKRASRLPMCVLGRTALLLSTLTLPLVRAGPAPTARRVRIP